MFKKHHKDKQFTNDSPINKQILIYCLLFIISFPIYYKSLNAPFILDDIPKIVMNPDIKELNTVVNKLIHPYQKNINTSNRNDPSRPVVYLTYALNYSLGELNPFGYRMFNLIIHSFNVVLIFILANKLLFFINSSNINKKILSLVTAFIFAIHPINSSVVAYVFNRSDILALFFYVLSIILFLNAFERNMYFLILSLLSFILSLFSKQISITLPLVLIIIDYVLLSNLHLQRVKKRIKYHAMYWILSIVYLICRYFYLGGIGDLEATEITIRWSDYFIMQSFVILRYVGNIFYPYSLSFFHIVKPLESIFEIRILVSVAIIFMLISLFVYLVKKVDRETKKILIAGVLWFLVTLSPTSSFFPTTNVMVENRLYLSAFGIYFIIAFTIVFLLKKLQKMKHGNINLILILFLIGYYSILCFVSYKRNRLYINPIMLWEDVSRKYPGNSKVHETIGILYAQNNDFEKAFIELKKATDYDKNSSSAHNNLGKMHFILKNYENAYSEFQEAIKIDQNNIEAIVNIATIYLGSRNYDKTFELLKKAIEIDQHSSVAHKTLGHLYYVQKKYSKALIEYEISLRNDPENKIIINCIENTKEKIKESL
ncbi:MAG: hypothetical protein A2252_05775 [Elusimicrobia bacterium RIFOXYA2_FULL_39_19]|nr:MAG: hypothetical protein A2252_05775 [Elusimicrobia bacterium RIFOXYA2_FULL_39_19]